MVRVAHITDLHFGKQSPGLAKALLRELQSLSPDLVAVSGDLTERARAKEFEAAGAFLRDLALPHLVVPGNHDIPQWFEPVRYREPFARYRNHIHGDLNPSLEGEGFYAMGLNSVQALTWHWDWGRGRLVRHQIRHVRHTLRRSPSNALRLVVLHHPFFTTQGSRRRGKVGRWRPAVDAWADGTVDLVLTGHLHRAFCRVAYRGGRETGGMVAVHGSTSLGSRVKQEPNAYNWIQYSGKELTVESRAWDGDRYRMASRWHFTRLGRCWQVSGLETRELASHLD